MSAHKRLALILSGGVVAAWLGTVQIASMSAYGDLATPHSLPALLFATGRSRLRGMLGGGAAVAAADLHDGDLAAAQQRLAAVPPGPPADDLRGDIAAAQGRSSAAFEWYLRAGDAVRAQNSVDAVTRTDAVAGLREQQRLVTTFSRGTVAGDQLADAWWRLGVLQREAGDRAGRSNASAALASFERAVALAPNRKSYLLAAGIQALKLGDYALAERRLTRAVDVGPSKANAYGALALADAAAGTCPAALAARAEWRRRSAPDSRAPEADPQLGAPLRGCLAERTLPSGLPPPAASARPAPPAPRRTPARRTRTRGAGRAEPPATASASPVCRMLHVSVTPASVRSYSHVTGIADTSPDVRSVAVSVGHLRPVHLTRTAPGRFEGALALPWIPWFLHKTFTVTFTGYDLRGHSDSSAVAVDVR